MFHRNKPMFPHRDTALFSHHYFFPVNNFPESKLIIGVRAGGARGAAAPPKFGQLRFFGQQEKIWAKPVFKDVSMFFIITIILKR